MELIDAIMLAKQIKELLNKRVQGKTMIKQDKGMKGAALLGIYHFDIYFDTPSSDNRTAITNTLKSFRANIGTFRTIGGAYGFKVHFYLRGE